MNLKKIGLLILAISALPFAHAKPQKLNTKDIHFEALVNQPIPKLDDVLAFVYQNKEVTQIRDMDTYLDYVLPKSSCSFVFPIGVEKRNPKFFEKIDGGFALKAGTKLTSMPSTSSLTVSPFEAGDGELMTGSAVIMSFQIVGRTPEPYEPNENAFDFSLHCTVTSTTDLDGMIMDRWTIDLDQIPQVLKDSSSDFLSIKFNLYKISMGSVL